MLWKDTKPDKLKNVLHIQNKNRQVPSSIKNTVYMIKLGLKPIKIVPNIINKKVH